MRHFAIAMVLGTLVFTIGVLLDPLTEHPVAAVPFVGIVFSAMLVHVIGAPLPDRHATVVASGSGAMIAGGAALLWLAVIAGLAGLPAPNTLTCSGLVYVEFWWIYLTTIATAINWPTGARRSSQK